MTLPFSFFLALKYLKPRRTFMSIIAVISVIGVMLGVAVLIIVISVMSGFSEMLREKILGFDSHLTVAGSNVIEDPYGLAEIIEDVDGVSGAAPYLQGLVFVMHDGIVQAPFMRGVDFEMEKKVSLIPESIIAGNFSLNYDEIVIGRDLAERLGAWVGDKLLVHSPQSFLKSGDEMMLPEELTVSGIFQVGMWEYDVGFVLLPIEVAREFYGMDGGAHAIRVMAFDPDPARVMAVARDLQARLRGRYPDMVATTWMELNRRQFEVLSMEKNMMFFLLIFIVLVAAFGITNSLIITVVQKTREIGLLKALGFSSGSIMRVFFWQGWIQGAIGTGLGIGLGFLALHFRNDLMRWMAIIMRRDLFPKEWYLFDAIPANTSSADVLFIALLSMAICTLSGIIPAYRAARLDPAKSLRYE